MAQERRTPQEPQTLQEPETPLPEQLHAGQMKISKTISIQ